MNHIETMKLALEWFKWFHGDETVKESRATDVIAALQAALAEPSEPDKDLCQAITERDEYHDMADKLAEGIALHFDGDIGEHSSSNSPWDRALDLLDSAACSETMRLSTALTAALPEPVAIVGELSEPTRVEVLRKGIAVGAYLYLHPPVPEPLTDNEIEDYGFTMLPNVQQGDFMAFARSIEAAIRGKT